VSLTLFSKQKVNTRQILPSLNYFSRDIRHNNAFLAKKSAFYKSRVVAAKRMNRLSIKKATEKFRWPFINNFVVSFLVMLDFAFVLAIVLNSCRTKSK